VEINIYDRLTSLITADVVKAIFSGGYKETSKAILRKVQLRGVLGLQVEKFIGKKALHDNIGFDKIIDYIRTNFHNAFRQIDVFCVDKTVTFLVSKNGLVTERQSKAPAKTNASLSHNREKSYILSEGKDIPVLKDLGIFNSENRLIKAKADKFKQINRFVELIDDEFKSYDKPDITILDFGCGKSYLTFVVYYYFKHIRGIDVKVIGYDIKSEIVTQCNKLAKKYAYNNLTFLEGDVACQEFNFGVDMVITLHACNTATDHALAKAIKNKVGYIFSVPCCQHEINAQLKTDSEYQILTEHGLIKERFSALITDAIRAEVLLSCNYAVDVIEFVDFEHSPKNLMIRAKLKTNGTVKPNLTRAEKLLEDFACKHCLVELIKY